MHYLRYAEVLKNTQYALIATVQKLYTMVRNNESWDLEEPGSNDRGQPIIQDITSRFGCIRPSPDLTIAFPEGANDFAHLQVQLQAVRSEMCTEDRKGRESSVPSPSLLSLAHAERASSTNNDHSELCKNYNQTLSAQQQRQWQTGVKNNLSAPNQTTVNGMPVRVQQYSDDGSYTSTDSARTRLDTNASVHLPVYPDFQTQSPMFCKASPFPSRPTNGDFLGQLEEDVDYALNTLQHWG
jgi:hypothetical protein